MEDPAGLNVKMLKLIYSAIKSEDSEALDSGTSQLAGLGSQRWFGGIEMF